MSITSKILPPQIHQRFDPFLLMGFLERIYWNVMTNIDPLADKKIRERDIGRRREFDRLMQQFTEVYERKIKEEDDYQAAREEAFKKRSHIPTSSGTCKFKRMES